MMITTKITNTNIKKKESVKKKSKEEKTTIKIEFYAKFDDDRYNIDYQIKIKTSNQDFLREISTDDEYYFIADGTLFKDKGKYIKFEINKDSIVKIGKKIKSKESELFS